MVACSSSEQLRMTCEGVSQFLQCWDNDWVFRKHSVQEMTSCSVYESGVCSF